MAKETIKASWAASEAEATIGVKTDKKGEKPTGDPAGNDFDFDQKELGDAKFVAGKEAGSKNLEVLPSKETANIVANIDLTVLSREKAYADLGEIAKKDIYYGDDKKQAAMDAKTTQELEMTKGLDDAAYAKLSAAEKVKYYLSFSFARKSGENIQRISGRGLVDTSKLEPEAVGQHIDTLPEEREQVADSLAKSGIKKEEIDGMEMSIHYEERGGRVVKILERTKTEDEIARAAAKIIEADLTGLEKGLGADLIKNKESLEKHNESSKSVKELTRDLGPAATKGIEDKMKKEGDKKTEAIKKGKETLDAELNKFRLPLEGRLKEISGIVDEFSTAFEDLKINENIFAERVRNFDAKIRQAERSGLLAETKKDLLEALATQKAQDVVDLKALKDKRETVQNRLTALKRDKEQTEKMLERINRIGKTREDLRKDQEAVRAAAEAAKSEAEATPPDAETGKSPAEGEAEDGDGDSGGAESGPGATSGAEAPAGAPKAGAAATKPEESPAEAPAGTKTEAAAEKEKSMTAGKVVERVMIAYNLKESDRQLVEKNFTKKGEEFKHDKLLREEVIRKCLDRYCQNVRKINGAGDRLKEVDRIVKILKENA
jgi:hypothetical protein